jgi:hypothetical protein
LSDEVAALRSKKKAHELFVCFFFAVKRALLFPGQIVYPASAKVSKVNAHLTVHPEMHTQRNPAEGIFLRHFIKVVEKAGCSLKLRAALVGTVQHSEMVAKDIGQYFGAPPIVEWPEG